MLAVSTPLDAGSWLVNLQRDGAVLAWSEVIEGLMSDPVLRAALTNTLLAAPVQAFYWEACPVAPDERDAPFECVVLDAPGLARTHADGTPFAEPLAGARAPEVRTFPNLAGDAELVVPAPNDDPAGYPHLAAFLRRAPETQVHALWSEVGRSVDRWLADRRSRVWVSTAGLGVSWLHMRLDSRPKYVKWKQYRVAR